MLINTTIQLKPRSTLYSQQYLRIKEPHSCIKFKQNLENSGLVLLGVIRGHWQWHHL